MNKREKITEIIAQRQPLAQNLARVEKDLNNLKAIWYKLEDYRNQLQQKTQDDTVLNKLQQINFVGYKAKIEQQLDKLTKLETRFQRSTINIGVVGRARQGKSRLLQSLTGLISGEIPDGSRQHCTGVRSTIHHQPYIETYGQVSFYTEHSFLNEIILPYYRELGLGDKPVTVQDFANNPLPSVSLEGAQNQAKYEHLRRYHTHFREYSHLLKTPSPRNIRQEEIRQYVAQDNIEGERIYFNYLAVREVEIFCQFPHQEVGQIAVVDMQGLGDTGIGDETRLIKTLAEDVDFVLFVKMPKPSGDYWADVDVKLYDTVNASLADLPVKSWSFMVLNRTDNGSPFGNNSNNCQDLIESMAEKHINVSDYIVANCANSEEVNEKILVKTLDYLGNNIAQLDTKYATAFYDQLAELQSGIKAELIKAQQSLSRIDNVESESKFDDLFDDFWEIITNNLTDLLEQLKEKRNDQDDYFKEQIEAVFKECKESQTIFPTLEEIKRRKNKEGDYPRAYGYYIDDIRTGLSRRFLNLDDGLHKSIEELKIEISNVLSNQCQLKGLSDKIGSEFLKNIANLIPEQCFTLKEGFTVIAEFKLLYRGLIQYRIREMLENLRQDNSPLPKNGKEQDVLDNLEELYKETVFECKNALDNDFLRIPSQAAFAIVEEFIDLVLRSKDAQRQWRKFLLPYRAEIWSDTFQSLGENTRLRQQWNQLIEEAAKINSSLLLN
jgi:hypothetical protein